MANENGFGKIYDSTNWGVGVSSNSISWGIIYLTLAQRLSQLALRFVDRVEQDGGVIESKECLTKDYSKYNWAYYYRVIDDGGVVESLECTFK